MPATDKQGEAPQDEMRKAFEAWAYHRVGDVAWSKAGAPFLAHVGGEADRLVWAWSAFKAACAYQREQDALICHQEYMRHQHGTNRVDPEDDYLECVKAGVAGKLAATVRSGASNV